MDVIYLMLLVLAAFCFALSAFRAAVTSKANLMALGLLLVVLVPLIQLVETMR